MTPTEIILIILIIVVFILIFVYMTFSRLHIRGKRRTEKRSDSGRNGRTDIPKTGKKRAGKNGAGGIMYGRPSDAFAKPGKPIPCPLCGSVLADGERVRSYVYRVGTDGLSHIFGCPHCDPGSRAPGEPAVRSAGVPLMEKICPVCRKPVPANGHLTARMFERIGPDAKKKTHVHVLGCTECRRGSGR